MIGLNPLAPGGGQVVVLEVGVLLGGGDPRVAEQVQLPGAGTLADDPAGGRLEASTLRCTGAWRGRHGPPPCHNRPTAPVAVLT